jgi:hypothetical protein
VKVRNLPTPEGRALGVELARLVEGEVAGKDDGRCATCAFRVGTDANGSPQTLMDAVKCAAERVPFYCHEAMSAEQDAAWRRGEDLPGNMTKLCAGWRAMLSPVAHVAPWPFSDEAA